VFQNDENWIKATKLIHSLQEKPAGPESPRPGEFRVQVLSGSPPFVFQDSRNHEVRRDYVLYTHTSKTFTVISASHTHTHTVMWVCTRPRAH